MLGGEFINLTQRQLNQGLEKAIPIGRISPFTPNM